MGYRLAALYFERDYKSDKMQFQNTSKNVEDCGIFNSPSINSIFYPTDPSYNINLTFLHREVGSISLPLEPGRPL